MSFQTAVGGQTAVLPDQKQIAVIVVNWNNWQDTCDCLTSLFDGAFQDFQIVLVDNGSTDGSVKKICEWAEGRDRKQSGVCQGKHVSAEFRDLHNQRDVDLSHQAGSSSDPPRLICFQSLTNLGFAKGCNVGLAYTIQKGFRYVFLLNNDTIVDTGCLATLSRFLDDRSDVGVATPVIRHYDDPDRIWAFGGSLTFFARRKMHLSGRIRSAQALPEFRDVTFVSGCALFARVDVFRMHGLLTESFFFGEEDYEFSRRMRARRIKMCAVGSAVIYHKVGRSHGRVFQKDQLPYVFIGFLNRFIGQKQYARSIVTWKLWRALCLAYIAPKLIFWHRFPLCHVLRMLRLLVTCSNQYDGVDRDLFFRARSMIEGQ